MVDEQLTDITTTIGSFVIRSIRGKFQRSISFSVGSNYNDMWMEEALYGILYKYNNIKKGSALELTNQRGMSDGSGLYCRLDDGTHTLKYRKWKILLVIQTKSNPNPRMIPIRCYSVITYDLSPEFVKCFESDMIQHRNSILRLKPEMPTFNVYKDSHDPDGSTYWDKVAVLPKRKLKTIYLPYEQKKLLVDTINNFMSSRKFYEDHGIPWCLKILLYGEAGTGKTSISKMIASEWNRNLFECTGGKNGRFIPDAISDNNKNIISPLFSISDIDKYPALINEPDVKIEEGKTEEYQLQQKQVFNNMINALDGVASEGGKIIIMTTNHIEKISETFKRPGRVDLIMHIGYITTEVFRKYTYDMYGIVLPKDIKLKEKDLTISKLQADVIFLKLSADEFIKKYVK